MRTKFSLFSSHLDLAHTYWARLITPEDTVIDATCGNGWDTLALAQCHPSLLIALDIQEEALKNTKRLLNENGLLHKASLYLQSHESFPPVENVKLIVYNLGYLPGGDKSRTTLEGTTLQSLQRAAELVVDGGAISITCYPGHPEGEKEQTAVVQWVKTLDPQVWNVCHHQWLNRHKSPSLLFLQKKQTGGKIGHGHARASY